ncbi:FadR family transcriptional regulator [Paenibacillus sp. SYP-B3998]|uniref:FadR family transcriptional regulator n=1 Tax=Paenibacillus sp. SYP-B3998 TaxID=2678564 RepID=A0A6G3ZZ83_9BACL|nr:FadR/GntR family transcriptional regulator [Paenibacillus sp. SYP-B3998]NEW07004.1 FadR family transcriptional regulator [Paenibacillus sp. SYP-B3998]
MLQKTNRLSLVEQVALQLESLIESRQWPVGTRIPAEPELMTELNVSRNTLREAIRALVHAGLLKTRQGDGTYVCSSSALGVVLQRRIRRSDAIETLEVRHALEREAAHLASKRRTEKDVEAIRAQLIACESAAALNDKEAYVLADIQLHQAIVEATHNGILIDLYAHIAEGLHESIISLLEVRNRDLHQQTHHRLVAAILAQDADQAVNAVHEYIEEYKKEFEMNLEEPL